MRPLILCVVLLAIASCRAAPGTPNENSVASPSNQVDSASRAEPTRPCLNLNIATTDELTRLPGIGEVMAKRIVDYREHHGRFRRPEEIIIIEGFSERKYRAIVEMICVK